MQGHHAGLIVSTTVFLYHQACMVQLSLLKSIIMNYVLPESIDYPVYRSCIYIYGEMKPQMINAPWAIYICDPLQCIAVADTMGAIQ